MSDLITQLFEPSVLSGIQTSISTQKPLFVYLSTGEDNMADLFLLSDTKPNVSVINVLNLGYICLKILDGLTEYQQFKQMVPAALAPSFTIVQKGKLESIITASLDYDAFVLLLQKYAKIPDASKTPTTAPRSPSSVEKHKSEFARHKHEEAEERKRLRALIDADRREIQAASKHNEEKSMSKSAEKHTPVPADKYLLSIRLLDGETVKGEFSGDQTLMDVKRWIEASQNVDITSDQHGLGMITKPGFPEPSHISFYSPGTRITYTEPQELCRLKDLDLFARLALILKPEFDDEKMTDSSKKTNLWHLAGSKMSTVLLALYSFFDYGVDDAHRDIQALGVPEEDEQEEEEKIPHFTPIIADSRPTEPPVADADVKNDEPIEALDYSLVGLTRQGTPGPSGTSRIHMSHSEVVRTDE